MRVAVVGAGLMGRWHAHTAQKLGAHVSAIVDSNAAAADRLAASVRGATAYGSLEELFRRAAPDVVHVCTPVESHVAVATAALRGGAHVVCEKPLAANQDATRELLEHAQQAGKIIRPVHQFASQRGVTRAKEWLPKIGVVSRISFHVRSAGAEGGDGARRDAVLADIVPHPFSVLAALWPRADLAGLRWHSVSSGPGEVDAHCLVASIPMSLAISMSARPTRCAMEIQGSSGSLLIDFFHGFCVPFSGDVSRIRKASYPLVDSARIFATAAGNLALRAWRREPAYPGLEQLFMEAYADIRRGGLRPDVDAVTLAVARARDEFLYAMKASAPPSVSAARSSR